MQQRTYPLARAPLGYPTMSYPVEEVNQAILFSHLRSVDLISAQGSSIVVQLLPDLASGGWRVRWDVAIIGSLPAQVRELYREVDRATREHMTPVVPARVRIVRLPHRPRTSALSLNVELPAVEIAMPAPAHPSGLLLPQGEPLALHSATAWPPGQYVASLHPDGQVHARVDTGTQELTLTAGLAEGEHWRIRGRIIDIPSPLGRVFSIDGQLLLDIGPGAAQEISPLAPLPFSSPTPYPAPSSDPAPASATSNPALPPETYAVTMEATDLAEPAPTGPRQFPAIRVEPRVD